MKKNDETPITNVWAEYEKGTQYNRQRNLYSETEQNYDFYHGDQWKNAELGDIKPITFNVIKPIVKYKVGIINSKDYQIVYNPNNYETQEFQDTMKELCKHLNKHTNKVWELEQMDRKVREAVKDACINSEGILYFYMQVKEDGTDEIKCQVIDKTNIYYGNENDDDIQAQPYMIIAFRKTVEEVKKEAKANGISEEEINLIVSDEEYDEQSGKDLYDEITPMCLTLLKLYKKNGTIHSQKSTRTVIIQKETDHKMKYYPVAHIVWEDVKGYSRGLGEVKHLIPNQIEINRTAMRRTLAVKMGAYPKLAVVADQIANPESLTQVGSTIKLKGQTVADFRNQVGYLTPATMSSDSKELQTELITNTRELAGAGDIATGDVNPEQASGKAILAIQQASQQPLTEQSNKFKTFVEDIAKIWFDMWQAYEINGMTIIATEENEQGEEVEYPVTIERTQLETLKVNIKIDITPKSPFDKYAQEMSLENLMQAEKITFEEYVKILPDDSVMPKHLLLEVLKKREEAKAEIEAMQQEVAQQQMEMNQVLQQGEMQENDNIINTIKEQGNKQHNEMAGAYNEM